MSINVDKMDSKHDDSLQKPKPAVSVNLCCTPFNANNNRYAFKFEFHTNVLYFNTLQIIQYFAMFVSFLCVAEAAQKKFVNK